MPFLKRRLTQITDNELRDVLEIICDELSSKFFGENDLRKALKKLSDIVKHVPNYKIFNIGGKKIIHCIITIIFLYDDKYKFVISKFTLFKSDKHIKYKQQARNCYRQLLSIFAPKNSAEIVNIVIQILTQENSWKWEDLCEILIMDLFDFGVDGSIVLNSLLSLAESKETSPDNARRMIRVLYEILETYSWSDTEETFESIERLLTIYQSSTSLTQDQSHRHVLLKKGLEICIRNAINHLPNHYLLSIIYRMCSWTLKKNSNEETIHEFGRTLEYAANTYKTNNLEDALQEKLFLLLMSMISSKKRLVSLLGNRIFQYLIDRKKNITQFESLRKFFENTNYDIKLHECNKKDEEFLKIHREVWHDSFLQGMINHCSSRLSLEAIYCSLGLIAVEIPCGFTAAALSCLIMNFQDFMVKNPEIEREISCHVHAMVISIMSLICWIHKAKVFYAYVNKITMERAQYAPHLNPPLSTHYDFAIHHVLWDKPELFFVDWEIRYGLWKCFRLQSSDPQKND